MRLTEDLSKAWLRARDLPVPDGAVAESAASAAQAAARLGGSVAVKALVPAGRRGKAGAISLVGTPEEAEAAATALLGREVAGFIVERLYVERKSEIAREFYLSFAFGPIQPKIVLSRFGGVDIEETHARDPEAVVSADIDPRLGLAPWVAVGLWRRAGVESAHLPRLAALTVALYRAFCDADAVTLEINPLALDRAGAPCLVGTMMEIDENAVFRHPEWNALAGEVGSSGRVLNARERAVVEADRKFPGGAVRYTELDGSIGLMVAGGGASLLQHDLVVAAGGRPANHSDFSPTPTPDKPAAVFDAIFGNPNVRSLLIGFNHLQMAPCDTIIRALLMSMERNNVDATRLPIVVRLFGPKEEEARDLVASVEGVRYLPSDATLADGVRAVVAATPATAPPAAWMRS